MPGMPAAQVFPPAYMPFLRPPSMLRPPGQQLSPVVLTPPLAPAPPATKKIVIRTPQGVEINIEDLRPPKRDEQDGKSSAAAVNHSRAVRIESVAAKRQRLLREQNEKEKEKAAQAQKERQDRAERDERDGRITEEKPQHGLERETGEGVDWKRRLKEVRTRSQEEARSQSEEAQRVREETERLRLEVSASIAGLSWSRSLLRPSASQPDGTARRTASSLSKARAIEDLDAVIYPEGIRGPNVDLNVNAKTGRFR